MRPLEWACESLSVFTWILFWGGWPHTLYALHGSSSFFIYNLQMPQIFSAFLTHSIPVNTPQERLGYDSTWRKRPRPSSADGCCLAWRRQLFDLVAEESVEFVAGKKTGRTWEEHGKKSSIFWTEHNKPTKNIFISLSIYLFVSFLLWYWFIYLILYTYLCIHLFVWNLYTYLELPSYIHVGYQNSIRFEDKNTGEWFSWYYGRHEWLSNWRGYPWISRWTSILKVTRWQDKPTCCWKFLYIHNHWGFPASGCLICLRQDTRTAKD